MSGDRILTATVPPAVKDRLRELRCLLGTRRHGRGDNRDVVGTEQVPSFQRGEPLAPVGDDVGNDALRGGDVGGEVRRQTVRCLHQLVLGLAVSHDVHEPAHGVGFVRVMRNSRFRKGTRGRSVLTEPNSEYRLLKAPCSGCPAVSTFPQQRRPHRPRSQAQSER